MNIDTQTVEGQAQEKDRFIGWHVVAFLDLLGQQDALSKITALPMDFPRFSGHTEKLEV